ncbi:hypothetical protein BELL_0126g00200 [Botrytis elliptica]|uniref:Uncharacterized protein n=1 Tax=Botrytis elliptica TaxID=278938 RepID=A0A4Z1JTB3_9HELO|nr:hypothetical protein BELL_0126g00200 [Botrytis elliptica]
MEFDLEGVCGSALCSVTFTLRRTNYEDWSDADADAGAGSSSQVASWREDQETRHTIVIDHHTDKEK